MSELTTQLIYALAVALVYGLASYFKNSNIETFSWFAFIKTLIVGALVGYVMYQAKLTYDQAFQWVSTNIILMTFIDDLINKILRFKPTLKSATVMSR